MKNMSRKEFLGMAAASLFLGADPFKKLEAAAPNLNDVVLLNLLLEGGPDFRHMIVPEPTTAYGQAYWKYRAGSQGVSSSSSTEWQNRFNQDYEKLSGTNGNPSFGILKKCGWLIQKYKEGKVAIVCNVKHSESRDHQRSLLVLQKGNYSTAAFTTGGSGWGGRVIGGANAETSAFSIVSVTPQIKPFCDGNSANVISFRNSRKFGLYTPTSLVNSWDNAPSTDSKIVMYRALKTYYERRTGLDTTNFDAFKKHYDRLRAKTDLVKTRISASKAPSGITGLSTGTGALNNTDFAQQIQSAYDAFLCKDILNMRVLSMNYTGWDTHKRQKTEIEAKLEDIFGTSKGFDQLFTNQSSAFSNTVISVSGEFGRQLRANGDNSTDHGDANYVLLIGGRIVGGTYGELFPSTETAKYDSFGQAIQSRNNFLAAYQSVLGIMGVTSTQVFNMTLTAGTDYETGFGSFTGIAV